jgi:hypothetical protein
MTQPTDGWTEDWCDTWTRTIPGQPGRSDLLLRVFPDPDHQVELWTWEVLALDEDADRKVNVGGGVSRDAAMNAATAWAAAYVGRSG